MYIFFNAFCQLAWSNEVAQSSLSRGCPCGLRLEKVCAAPCPSWSPAAEVQVCWMINPRLDKALVELPALLIPHHLHPFPLSFLFNFHISLLEVS